MKKNSIKKNYIYNLFYQLLTILLPLLTTPYLSKVLGANGIGIYSYTLSITTYFILIGAFGTALYGQREIAYVQDDIQKKTQIFFEIVIIKIITMSLISVVYGLVFCFFSQYYIYYRVFLLEILANVIDISWFYQGIEDFKKIVVKNTVVKLISIISIFVFVKSTNDTWKYILIYCLSNLLGNLSMWLNMKKNINISLLKGIKLKKHLKPMLLLFIPQLAISVYTVLDKSMIGTITSNMSEVGFYEQSQKIVKLSLTLLTSLGTVMLPKIASINSKNDMEKIKKYIYGSFRFSWLLASPICFGLIGISSNIVPWFYGQGFEKVSLLICVFCPMTIFISLANVIGNQYLIPMKKQNKYTVAVIISAIVNIIGNLFLIPKFLSVGAAISSAFSELVGLFIELFMIRKEFEIKKILKMGLKYVMCSIIMVIIVKWLSLYLKPMFLNTMILTVIGLVIYMIMLTILKDDYILYAFNKIRRKGER